MEQSDCFHNQPFLFLRKYLISIKLFLSLITLEIVQHEKNGIWTFSSSFHVRFADTWSLTINDLNGALPLDCFVFHKLAFLIGVWEHHFWTDSATFLIFRDVLDSRFPDNHLTRNSPDVDQKRSPNYHSGRKDHPSEPHPMRFAQDTEPTDDSNGQQQEEEVLSKEERKRRKRERKMEKVCIN